MRAVGYDGEADLRGASYCDGVDWEATGHSLEIDQREASNGGPVDLEAAGNFEECIWEEVIMMIE